MFNLLSLFAESNVLIYWQIDKTTLYHALQFLYPPATCSQWRLSSSSLIEIFCIKLEKWIQTLSLLSNIVTLPKTVPLAAFRMMPKRENPW